MRASVYDMAGQRCFYDIHHLCGGGARSLYLVVFDLRAPLGEKAIDLHDDGEAKVLERLWALCPLEGGPSLGEVAKLRLAGEDCEEEERLHLVNIVGKIESSAYTNHDRLNYWLTSVYAIAPESSVLVIGTHRDAVSDETLKERCRCVRASWILKPYRHQVRGEVITVESSDDVTRGQEGQNLDTRSNIAFLRKEIERTSRDLPGMKQEYPLVWLHMLRWARDQVQQGVYKILREEFAAAAKKQCGEFDPTSLPSLVNP